MIIGLQTTNLCQLRCKNCASSIMKAPKIENKLKNPKIFKETIQRMIDFGLTRFNFTPTLGDPFTDSTMLEKLKWMDDKPEVEMVEFFTNFLGLTDNDIKRLVKFKKIRMCISVYGCTVESYNEFTGTQGVFFIWERNLSILKQYWRSEYPVIYFCIRNRDFYNKRSKVQTIIDSMKNNYDNIRIDDISENCNWAGLFDSSDYKIKDSHMVCQQLYIGTQILENGDVSLCGCWDAKQEMIIGDIFEQSFEEIYGKNSLYQKCLENQSNGFFDGICKYCDDRAPYKPEQEFNY